MNIDDLKWVETRCPKCNEVVHRTFEIPYPVSFVRCFNPACRTELYHWVFPRADKGIAVECP